MSLLPWDARAYDEFATPHDRWGLETINRLGLTGTESVLDFGCGTGRDAERLLDALPSGRVVAVDGSPDMLARLRQRLAHRLHSIEVIEADLRAPLPVMKVDAVMSVATLHWLPDHRTVFANIAEVLRSGGRFAAEAGGAGNIAAVLAAASRVGQGLGDTITSARATRNFADVEETVQNLSATGFVDAHVELVADPLSLPASMFEGYLAAVVLVPELSRLEALDRLPFVHAVAQEIGEPTVDWVRIRLTATRP